MGDRRESHRLDNRQAEAHRKNGGMANMSEETCPSFLDCKGKNCSCNILLMYLFCLFLFIIFMCHLSHLDLTVKLELVPVDVLLVRTCKVDSMCFWDFPRKREGFISVFNNHAYGNSARPEAFLQTA